MDRTARIAELEQTLRWEEEQAKLHWARARAAEAELQLLRAGATPATDLAALPRTDAIVEVLHRSDRPCSPTQVAEALAAAGRTGDTANKINATLGYLVAAGRIAKVGRGVYTAAA